MVREMKRKQTIQIKRVYEAVSAEDGTCFLVDRLWPRGIRKEALQDAHWLKDAAPTEALRRWFAHDPRKWDEFRLRYFAELDGRPQAWQAVLDAAVRGPVTLLYAARDSQHNNAMAFREYLEGKRTRVSKAAGRQSALSGDNPNSTRTGRRRTLREDSLPATCAVRGVGQHRHLGIALHWHGETFDLPDGAIHLGETDVCIHQAFEHKSSLALQFHLESGPEDVEQPVHHCAGEIGPGPYQ